MQSEQYQAKGLGNFMPPKRRFLKVEQKIGLVLFKGVSIRFGPLTIESASKRPIQSFVQPSKIFVWEIRPKLGTTIMLLSSVTTLEDDYKG
jgi:hypothetical protein